MRKRQFKKLLRYCCPKCRSRSGLIGVIYKVKNKYYRKTISCLCGWELK